MTMIEAKAVPIRQRVLSVALLLTMVLSMWSVTIVPLYHRYESLNTQRDELLLRRSKLLQLAEIGSSNNLGSGQMPSGYSLGGADVSAANSEFQSLFRGLAQAHGVVIGSLNTGSTPETGNFKRIRLNARLTASLSALSRLIYALETTRPLVTVEVFSAQLAPDGAVAAPPEALLEAQLTASAYYMGE